jgi:hypothetical protein
LDKRYNVFLSHASEDKDFVAPLAEKLINLGLDVWYDDYVLRIGQQLRVALENGLKKSDNGVIVLSKNFFTKMWTQLELDALINLLNYNINKIFPIWHGVNKHDVEVFSPFLVTFVGRLSSVGIDKISIEIYEEINNNQPIRSESRFKLDTTDPQIEEIQSRRFRFLLKLYETRDRRFLRPRKELGNELGFDDDTLAEVSNYYLDKYFIEYPASGCIEITMWGMDHVEEIIPDNPEVQKVQSNRGKVLTKLYKVGSKGIDIWELGKELGIDDKTTDDMRYYLVEKGLTEMHYSFVRLTTDGIDYAENNLF